MSEVRYFSAVASNSKIDGGSGIIYGVSVITEGEAAGCNAGTFVDRTTLSQLRSTAAKFPDGVKVKLSQNKEHDGSAGQIVGVIRNFSIDGKQVRGDLHLLKSAPSFSHILEMAQTMPSEFGLSVVIPKDIEKVDGRDCLRCSEIYSVDLVEAPAANPSGLFSAKPTEQIIMSEKTIKYAKGESGDHAKDCECKECSSMSKKKEMSALLASILGLSAEASETEIQAAFKASSKPADLTALTSKIDATTLELSALKTANANALALSKKAQIDNLVAEAGRNGQVIPLENEDLYTIKDGICSIHTEPEKLIKMLSKLPKGSVTMSKKREFVAPTTADGKAFDRSTPEGRAETIAFCRRKQAENAPLLGAEIKAQNRMHFSETN